MDDGWNVFEGNQIRALRFWDGMRDEVQVWRNITTKEASIIALVIRDDLYGILLHGHTYNPLIPIPSIDPN